MPLIAFLLLGLNFVIGSASAQSTAGIATTVVFPVAAQTASFASEMTLFNPGPNALTASVSFYEANNSGAPGPKICNDVTVPAARSAQITLSTQCALTGSGGHFGLVVVADKAAPPVNAFYGYTRVQNPQGIGFSVEGFPVTSFNNQVSHATGLKRKAAAPTYQTNCFVGSLDQPVSYQLKLFNDSTGAQVGGTLTGSLAAFQQFRYLDVFGINGVNAPAGDLQNVRAQFTQTSGGSANLVGFCTVQDNTSFGADFRIAKSYGSPSSSFFAQGGNAFGAAAMLGTLDNQPLSILVNNQRVTRYVPTGRSPDIVSGHPSNDVSGDALGGETIAGGGDDSSITCFDPLTNTTRPCSNRTLGAWATVSGGVGNQAEVGSAIGGGFANTASGAYSAVAGGAQNFAHATYAAVAGGVTNTSSGQASVVSGGTSNVAGGTNSIVAGGQNSFATGVASIVAGGASNQALGTASFAAGTFAIADKTGEFVWADNVQVPFNPSDKFDNQNGTFWLDAANTFNVRATGGVLFVSGVNASGFPSVGVSLHPGAGSWTTLSDRAVKENFRSVDAGAVLEQIAHMPIETWNYIAEGAAVRHLGPMAQDFRAAFGLGTDERTITEVDANGVAFAAIQGLHRLIAEKDAKIEAQGRRIEALEKRAAALESMHDEVAELRAVIAAVTHGATSVATTMH